MSTHVVTESRTGRPSGRDGFAQLLSAEWTKLATVRGWVIGIVLAPFLIVGIALLNHSTCGGVVTPGGPATTGAGCAAPPTGPGGEAVSDSFYFVRQPLAGNGGITARMTSLTAGAGPAGLAPWSKAGIIMMASARPGSAYAAMMVTGGHGVRMQYDYTGDIAGPPGGVSAGSPRWLRLTRAGDTITGYTSADGVRWTTVGTARLAGLPATLQAGMFATAPASSQTTSQSVTGASSAGAAALAAARFDHVSLAGPRPPGAWAGDPVGGASPGTGFHQAGGTFAVTGTGDIAPYVPGASGAPGATIGSTLLGAVLALIAAVVVATMFMTSEYRRGLIRVTLAASPARGRVLAAKAVVIASVTFIAGLAGAIVAVQLGERLLRSNGNFILPASTFSNLRVVAGTAALLAVASVFALALGTILRRSAGAVTVVIALITLPYLLALTALRGGAGDWLLRVTPAAAFAIQQTTPQYPQVSAAYTVGNGYFPLTPWAGFAVLCSYTAVALGLAIVLVRRRDA
jgi:ABC-type transport system involved in multi-copper enzyme maturation permease subunit